ncbi:MAG: hydrogenase formation protein HypD [Candidatus Omnitrophica bacterium]|nr:hydrogenase formation protein HypD [Candidatus Omnitrophota bacterium]
MKYIDEFRDRTIVKGLMAEIGALAKLKTNLMEVCGTHTMAIFRSGIKQLLPAKINLISGPGCPVCVTAQADIDRMLTLAKLPGVIITTFGDMLKVPGTQSSLEKERAAGCDIRVVYSPLDALEIARQERSREVIFLAVGFETTAPAIASVTSDARAGRIKNFSVYCCHKLIPPAMAALLEAKEIRIHGFICPGHVSTIIGTRPYALIAEEFRIPCVVSGFEPTDILESIRMLLQQIRQKRADAEIQYRRAVRPEGNLSAQQALSDVFMPSDADWRGLGVIPKSGLKLREQYQAHDAEIKFDIKVEESFEAKQCLCGQVLRGVKNPSQCRLFATVCTPEQPYGPCMVSTEGTCAAWYKYHR